MFIGVEPWGKYFSPMGCIYPVEHNTLVVFTRGAGVQMTDRSNRWELWTRITLPKCLACIVKIMAVCCNYCREINNIFRRKGYLIYLKNKHITFSFWFYWFMLQYCHDKSEKYYPDLKYSLSGHNDFIREKNKLARTSLSREEKN